MTRWGTRDAVPMRLARPGAAVEHNRQRSDRHREDGSDRNSRRLEHLSILSYCDVRLLSGGQLGHRGRPPTASRFNPIAARPVGVPLVHFPDDLGSGPRVLRHKCQLLRLRGLVMFYGFIDDEAS